MRYLIISDIHANLSAFESVMEHASGEWDMVWCLGDIIGYGPDPNECVALLRQYDHLSLSGNHDWAVLGRLDLTTFNADARAAIAWAQSVLSEDSRSYLEVLQADHVEGDFTLAHGSPRQPIWEYILDSKTAAANFDHFSTPFCLVGHTHAPIVFEHIGKSQTVAHLPVYGQPLPLDGTRLIINPGSVGQPRDHDPRAAYAILDGDKMTWEHRRVSYPISVTQDRMGQHGLPFRLISRLQFGW